MVKAVIVEDEAPVVWFSNRLPREDIVFPSTGQQPCCSDFCRQRGQGACVEQICSYSFFKGNIEHKEDLRKWINSRWINTEFSMNHIM